MIKVEELFIAPTATVLETLRKLDETGQRILFIAPEGHLKAVITCLLYTSDAADE